MSETLLQETVAALANEGLRDADVQWVGSAEAWFDWSDFAKLAEGAGTVPGDLVVVGKDWWIDRLGANKGWTLSAIRKDVPPKPARHFVPTSLLGRDTVLPDDAREFFDGKEEVEAMKLTLQLSTERAEVFERTLKDAREALSRALQSIDASIASLEAAHGRV